MTSKIEVSREMAERIVKDGAISVAQIDQLRQKLAAHEAPRQDAIGTLKRVGQNIIFDAIGDPHIRDGMEVFTAPLSPDHSGGGAGMVIEYAAKSLATITSSDGSGHADIALSILRQAGYAYSHAKKLVDEWKSQRSWVNPECKARGAGEVILPDRMQIPDQETFVGGNAYYAKSFDEARIWNACLDKVKELNQ